MSINVSTLQLETDDIVEQVRGCSLGHGA